MPLVSYSTVGKITSLVVSSALLLVYFTNLPLWLDRFNGTAHAPNAYLLVLVAALIIGLIRFRRVIVLKRAAYLIWCCAFVALLVMTLVRMYFFQYSPEQINELTDQLQRGLLALAFGMLVYFTHRSHYQPALYILAIVAPAIILVEFFNPDLLSEAYKNSAEKVRVSGFWGNENAAGEVIALCVVLVSRNARKLVLMILYCVAFVAILFTGSRAGMAGITVIGIMLLAQRKLPILFLAAPVVLAITFSSAVVFVEDLVEASGRESGTEEFIDRLTYFFNEDREEDYSEESRSEIFVNGLREAVQRPVAGHAVPYIDETHEVGSHNLLVNLFYQFGLFGVALWVWLGVLLYRRRKPVFTNLELFCFLWFTMFSHNILDYNWWYIFLALSLIPQAQKKPTKVRKKRKRRRKKRDESTVTDMDQAIPNT